MRLVVTAFVVLCLAYTGSARTLQSEPFDHQLLLAGGVLQGARCHGLDTACVLLP